MKTTWVSSLLVEAKTMKQCLTIHFSKKQVPRELCDGEYKCSEIRRRLFAVHIKPRWKFRLGKVRGGRPSDEPKP
jgi:hypothetical protein